jgi:hypothetical protein
MLPSRNNGAGLETSTQRHEIMVMEYGAMKDEIYQTVLMAKTTMEHPGASAGWKWVESVPE